MPVPSTCCVPPSPPFRVLQLIDHFSFQCLPVLVLIDMFSFQLVAPKRKRLEIAESELAIIVKDLSEKQANLNVILTQFQSLNDDFTAKTTKKEVSVSLIFL